MRYATDAYGVVVNGHSTVYAAAAALWPRGSVTLNWGDGEGTVLNLMFSLNPQRAGASCGVIDGVGTKLWVGVAGRGCFAFRTDGGYLAPSYVAEKLNVVGWTATSLTELISGILQELSLPR